MAGAGDALVTRDSDLGQPVQVWGLLRCVAIRTGDRLDEYVLGAKHEIASRFLEEVAAIILGHFPVE